MSATLAPEKKALVPAATHPAFELLREETVGEIDSSCALYRHKASGAEILSIQAPDDNKVFGITFRTPPSDSTGVPHILEHSVLCGSRKFPVKDPFVYLLKGSLHTYLNAMTYPDKTCYPVASQNLKDFYNLVDVYLDAVLHPRALSDPQVLEQEGWHYELEDASAPLTFKGVVFNEMKGVYSSPDSVRQRTEQQSLFPDNTYGVDSGGDPFEIPSLTFEGFRDFHGRYYHPSNSRIFFYGDDPPAKRLEILDEYLSEYKAIPTDSSVIQPQKLFAEPRKIVDKYPRGADEEGEGGGASGEDVGKNMLSVNWVMTDEALTPKDMMALSVMDHLLMGTRQATLYKALVASGLGASVIGGGFDDTLAQPTFSCGLKGVKPEDSAKVEKLILDTLKQVVEDGFEASAVEAAMNTIEFTAREFNTGGSPKGLTVMLITLTEWLHGRDPLSGLKFEAPLAELKADLAKPGARVFEGFLERMLVANQHRVTVEMMPDAKLEEEQEGKEVAQLEQVKASMDEAALTDVMEKTASLKAMQAKEDAPEDVAKIPALSKEDLDPKARELPIEVGVVPGTKSMALITHDLPTSGILYADIGLDLTRLTRKQLMLLPLFTRMLLETGAGDLDEVALSRAIGARTGGIYTGQFITPRADPNRRVVDGSDLVGYLFVRGKATRDRLPELFDLMLSVLTESRLDSQTRAVEMLKETVARMETAFIGAGHQYAAMRLNAQSTLEGAISEEMSGVSSLALRKALLEQAQSDWPALLAELESMRKTLLDRESMLINLSGDKKTLAASSEPANALAAKLPEVGAPPQPGAGVAGWKEAGTLPKVDEGFALPTQVNYVGFGGRLFEPGEVITGATSVVTRFLDNGYLWDTVRVMGGAYGGFSVYGPRVGTFAFLSYRDPNVDGTLDAYTAAAAHLQGLELSDEQLEQAVIGMCGDLDRPMSADTKGYVSLQDYLTGNTLERRQIFRNEVLATTADDFKAVGNRLAEFNKKAKASIFSSKKQLEEAKVGSSLKVTEVLK